jgi:DNA polymerase I
MRNEEGMKRTLLIDGDEYLFKACSAVERETRWDDWNHVLHCNRQEAWDNFTRMVSQLGDRLDTDDTVLCFSGSRPYFRELLEASYKGERTKSRKPLCYSDLREMCADHYIVRSLDGLEADDVMGLLQTKPPASGLRTERTIICSQDKDMQTIPGTLWRQGELQEISVEQADRFFLFQALKGDPTDGYKGCPGMGDKRAEAWLAGERGDGDAWSWPRVVAAYVAKGLGESDALLQARLARILRWDDWDTKEKKVKLWSPAPAPSPAGNTANTGQE